MADWGDVPTWLGGIGTTLAVSVALWAALYEYRLRRRADHRRQADGVSVWVTNPKGPDATGGTFFMAPEWVALSNSSGAVVYDVVVEHWQKVRSSEAPQTVRRFFRFLPPGVSFSHYAARKMRTTWPKTHQSALPIPTALTGVEAARVNCGNFPKARWWSMAAEKP